MNDIIVKTMPSISLSPQDIFTAVTNPDLPIKKALDKPWSVIGWVQQNVTLMNDQREAVETVRTVILTQEGPIIASTSSSVSNALDQLWAMVLKDNWSLPAKLMFKAAETRRGMPIYQVTLA